MSRDVELGDTVVSSAAANLGQPHPRWVPYANSPYLLGERIASGGMGSVHLGLKQGALGFRRLLAIKRLHAHLAQDPQFVARFKDEIRLVSRLDHPNVIQTFDVLERDEELALVMEYVDGVTLQQLLKDASSEASGALPVGVAIGILAQSLHGIHAAHELCDDDGRLLQLVHRDFSPQNIMIARDGLAKVLDFGIAKAASETHVTHTGHLAGKVAYMAPEQASGSTIDRRTDVFAAGVVLWEALAGQRLFRPAGVSEGAAMKNVLDMPVRPPSALRPEVSPALDRIVMRALEREPSRRFGSARDFALALEDAEPQASLSTVAGCVMKICRARLADKPGSTVFRDKLSPSPADPRAADPRAAGAAVSLPPQQQSHWEAATALTHSHATKPEEPVFPAPSRRASARKVVVAGAALLLPLLGGLAIFAREAWRPSGEKSGASVAAAQPSEGTSPEAQARNERSLAPLPERTEGALSAPASGDRKVDAVSAPASSVGTVDSSASPPRSVGDKSRLDAAKTTGQKQARPRQAPKSAPAAPEQPAPLPKAKSAQCSPPTYIDADGIRHFKPECL